MFFVVTSHYACGTTCNCFRHPARRRLPSLSSPLSSSTGSTQTTGTTIAFANKTNATTTATWTQPSHSFSPSRSHLIASLVLHFCSHFCLLVRHRQFAIYLSVDSSVCSVRWTLAQDCSNGRRRPSRVLFWNFGGAHLYITFFFTRIRTLLLIFVVVSTEPQRRAYQQELQIIR